MAVRAKLKPITIWSLIASPNWAQELNGSENILLELESTLFADLCCSASIRSAEPPIGWMDRSYGSRASHRRVIIKSEPLIGGEHSQAAGGRATTI